MITDQVVHQIKKEKVIQCELCHSDIRQEPSIKRLGVKFGVVCKECVQKFSDQEIELMANMFLAFGGYYNQFHSSKDVQFQVFKQIAIEYKQNHKNGSELESDIKTLYKAFLHGIPLAQLIHGVHMLLQ